MMMIMIMIMIMIMCYNIIMTVSRGDDLGGPTRHRDDSKTSTAVAARWTE
jgi:hypothetical protein